uniref:PAR1 protein n=1 Tax=Kalanchoe fedtschenkoi TaxID=63787 RepID=A0A7N0TTZ5_KALFE
MASTKFSRALFFIFASSFLLQAALAEIICDDLPKDKCAFAIASSGKRCLLETYASRGGFIEYQCKTSDVYVEKLGGHIESDECVRACGVDRRMVGISSDSLMEPHFIATLCSASCFQNCPNIADLYFNLAAGEGVFLPELCDKQRTNPHRAMIELMSSGEAAPGPASTSEQEKILSAEAPAPFWF